MPRTALSLNSLALVTFLFIPFAAFIVAPCFFIEFQRFGFQWHSLLFACLLVAALVLPQADFFPFLRKLFANKLLSFSSLIFFVWLVLMSLIHGFKSQSESLLSALLLLLMLPIGVYVGLDRRRQWRIADVGMALLLVVVLLENLFLTYYHLQQIPFNVVYWQTLSPLRLFLNQRDGNFVALILFLTMVLGVDSAMRQPDSFLRNNVFGSLALIGLVSYQSFYNAWLTQGRSLLLCLCSSIALMVWFGLKKRLLMMKQIAFVSMISCLGAFVNYKSLDFVVVREPTSAGLSSLVGRADGGRFELWASWLSSGLGQSPFWGHGLGFVPIDSFSGLQTPHNILVQLIADGGLLSLILFFGLSVVVVRACSIYFLSPYLVALVFPLLLSFAFSSNVYNSEAIWALSIFSIALLERFGSFESFVNANAVSSCKALPAISLTYFASICVLVVLLSSAKYLLY